MIPELKRFIEENIDLISDNEFNDVYNKIKSYKFTRLFTETMLEANIDPLNYMSEVPTHYLYQSTLQTVNIPVGIRKINEYAFAGCLNINELQLPEGLTDIGEGAFRNCAALEVLRLPSTLNHIDLGAFSQCKSLKEVIFAGTTKQWLNVKDIYGSLSEFKPIKCSDSLSYI